MEEIHLELTDEDQVCQACGNHMDELGETTREELVFIPVRLEKRIYHEQTYHRVAYKAGETCSIKRPESAKQPIQNSLSSPSILAQLFHPKYEMCLHLYRQVKEC